MVSDTNGNNLGP